MAQKDRVAAAAQRRGTAARARRARFSPLSPGGTAPRLRGADDREREEETWRKKGSRAYVGPVSRSARSHAGLVVPGVVAWCVEDAAHQDARRGFAPARNRRRVGGRARGGALGSRAVAARRTRREAVRARILPVEVHHEVAVGRADDVRLGAGRRRQRARGRARGRRTPRHTSRNDEQGRREVSEQPDPRGRRTRLSDGVEPQRRRGEGGARSKPIVVVTSCAKAGSTTLFKAKGPSATFSVTSSVDAARSCGEAE